MESVNGAQPHGRGASPPAGIRFDPATERLDGRVALVTGAGSPDGIGYATARGWPASAPRWRSSRPPGASTSARASSASPGSSPT